jgi:hypothetical protein
VKDCDDLLSPSNMKPRVKALQVSPRRATIQKLSAIGGEDDDLFFDAKEDDDMEVDSLGSDTPSCTSVRQPLSEEQQQHQPRFRDPIRTSRDAIEFLDALSPSSILVQAVAVNLSISYYTLYVSAGDAIDVPVVSTAFQRLRGAVDGALEKLDEEANLLAAEGAHEVPSENDTQIRSDALRRCLASCESACTALSQAEITVARAVSILHKVPTRNHLADSLLTTPDTMTCDVDDEAQRCALLDLALRCRRNEVQLSPPSSPAVTLLMPSSYEYVLRDTSGESACQLCVYRDEEATSTPGILVALTTAKRI